MTRAHRIVTNILRMKPTRKPGTWPALSAPVLPAETAIRMRAQSLLTGSLIGGVCPTLTVEQAKDVMTWAGELLTPDPQ